MTIIICNLIAVFGMTACIITLVRNIREDRESDRLYAIEDCRNVPCEGKTEHCDYCGTDDCIYHPNNE